jgi:hypothetical protein
VKNRDEKKAGNGPRSAAARVMKRDMGWRMSATRWTKRLSVGRRKREPSGVRTLMAG